jgi:hypothetical protein
MFLPWFSYCKKAASSYDAITPYGYRSPIMNGGGKELTREELYQKVWSVPTTQLAAELGISDVALAKRCKKLNVPKPSPGYWAKVTAGQKPEKIPLPPTASEAFIQAAEKPLPKILSLPETTDRLHPMAAELLRNLKAAKPSYDKRVWDGDMFSPIAKVGKDAIELTAKCFHVIVTNVELVGIPFTKPQGGHQAACFRKGNDRLYLEIEDELVVSTETGRRRSWQPYEDSRVPSGRLMFSLSNSRYSSGKIKEWKDDGKAQHETLLGEIVSEIRKYFVTAIRHREQEVIERKKQAIEWEKRRREYEKDETIRQEKELRQKHAEALETIAQSRADDLLKAAEWWRLHQTIVEFVDACERHWQDGQNGSLTSEQQSWLAWARDNAKAMSPFDTGYPDSVKDGWFDAAAVPFGGPYPAKRNFPRPPTMPKIPPPVIQQSGYPPAHTHTPDPYPFWLKYQGR